MRALVGMGLLSAATLLSEVALTRVFSIAQFHHFAFLMVSLALLGFGASGSLLALWPRFQERTLWPWYALGFAVSATLAYLFVDHFAFDSYSIAWDGTQAYLLIANLLGLAVPFVFAGALVGALLSGGAQDAGRIYGANLVGSAGGAVLAPLAISWLGAERAILLASALGGGAGLILATTGRKTTGSALTVLLACVALLFVFPAQLQVEPSPYKQLSQYRLEPEARITGTRQNASARLDIVESPTIHSAPGLSLAYLGELPRQVGLLVDGDDLLPVPQAGQAADAVARALPVAVAYAIRPGAQAVLLGSGGGMEAWAALANGARRVHVVEPNQLVYDALTGELRAWAGLADDPRVTLLRDEIRPFAERTIARYDVVELTLTDAFRPIASGAFSLMESYAATVEAYRSYLRLAGSDGLLVVTRWLQSPPSEDVRTLGLIIEALDGRPPLQHVVAFRSFQTATFLVKPTPFTPAETAALLAVIDRLRYDLILAPTMPPEMINRYARLETPVYHDLALQLATAPDRAAFYAAYRFEVSPPTDDRPFFFHFFRWEQTPEVIENLGRHFQPFGGSGYFVLLALLAFALVAALAFVVAPIGLRGRFRQALRATGGRRASRVLGYFSAIGLAFLLVEVALIQRFILVLGNPTLALATVTGALLFFSGLGSLLSPRLPWRPTMAALAFLVAVEALTAGLFTPALLQLPLIVRGEAAVGLMAPVGFLMGVPFARGVAALSGERAVIPWAWAANGGASVVSAVLAATLSLSLGFTLVLLLGGALYLVAAGMATRA